MASTGQPSSPGTVTSIPLWMRDLRFPCVPQSSQAPSAASRTPAGRRPHLLTRPFALWFTSGLKLRVQFSGSLNLTLNIASLLTEQICDLGHKSCTRSPILTEKKESVSTSSLAFKCKQGQTPSQPSTTLLLSRSRAGQPSPLLPKLPPLASHATLGAPTAGELPGVGKAPGSQRALPVPWYPSFSEGQDVVEGARGQNARAVSLPQRAYVGHSWLFQRAHSFS